jgi:hypothetical protein
MHPQLRAFLEANGLAAGATEQEAWDHYKKLQGEGIKYQGPEKAEAGEGEGDAQRSAAARQHSDSEGDGEGDGDNGHTRQATVDPAEVQRQVQAGIQAERDRARAIEDACAVAGLSAEEARALVDTGITIDQARAQIFDTIRSRNVVFGAGAQGAQLGLEDGEKFRAAAVDGLLIRTGRAPEQPAAGATEFRGRRLADIAGDCLQRAGVNVRGLNPDQIARRALSPQSSSDFPLLLAALANQSLQAAYTEAPSTFRQWVAVGDANDFKDIYSLKFSGSPDLEELTENGEIKTADFSESRESYRVVTKAIQAKFTRVMLVNDDLRAFTRVPVLIGAAAKRMENKMVYALLISNPAMSDGVALFHADHNNLGAAADIDSDGLGAARAAMRKQTGMAGEVLDIQPAYLLAGTDEETTADILLRSAALPAANMSAGVINPWAGKLIPITDPLLDITAGSDPFYLLASPNQAPVIEVAWLLGQEAPFVDDEMEFATGAITYACRHDFGCGVVDHVGGYKVPRS